MMGVQIENIYYSFIAILEKENYPYYCYILLVSRLFLFETKLGIVESKWRRRSSAARKVEESWKFLARDVLKDGATEV